MFVGDSGPIAGIKEIDDLDGVVAGYHGVLWHVAGADAVTYCSISIECSILSWPLITLLISAALYKKFW